MFHFVAAHRNLKFGYDNLILQIKLVDNTATESQRRVKLQKIIRLEISPTGRILCGIIGVEIRFFFLCKICEERKTTFMQK